MLRDKNLRDEVSDLLEVLDDRERKIIFQRFGVDGGKPKTLEEVGKKFGVTRERIRQLQNIALAKLRRTLSKKETPTYSSAGRKLRQLQQQQRRTQKIKPMKPQPTDTLETREPTKNHQILLSSRTSGVPSQDSFQVATRATELAD